LKEMLAKRLGRWRRVRTCPRHPEEREARLEGRRPPVGPRILRGSLRSYLRM